MRLVYLLGSVTLAIAGCANLEPNGVLVQVAPQVVSSIDGTATVQMMVVDDRTPVADTPVEITVSYTDRNGMSHAIAPVMGTTDARGAFVGVLTGLDWEGTGTVTAAVAGPDGPSADATFSVLDRTPPTVEILDVTTDNHVGPGLPIEVQVHVTDEIGVSRVSLEAAGELSRLQTTVVASGATDATLTFRLDIPDNALPGPTITLYALADDLSSNQAAAAPLILTVDPAIAIATPPGLTGTQVSQGTNQFLEDPRALAVSPKDGMIYVADNSQNNPCNGGCIRQVDPATGTVSAGAVLSGQQLVTGVAFDATGDTLYYSRQQDVLGALTWNGTAYTSPMTCNNQGNQNPRMPYHLVHDSSLGVLVADDDSGRLLREAACTGQDPTVADQRDFDRPRGVALDASGGIYVSDNGRREIDFVDRSNGSVQVFEDRDLDRPYGIDWLAGGSSAYADSLMIADNGNREVVSSTGNGPHPTAYLRDQPIDVAVDGSTMYILTQPGQGDPGRIFVVTGL